MTTHTDPYVERSPGDLITAEDWNDLQRQIRADIRATADDAASGVTHVARADDAGQLEGKDLDELTDEIASRVLDRVRAQSGYLRVFRVLKEDETDVIEHGFAGMPLVDLYKLEYFEVVCREDDDTYATFATFYLHHTSEKRVRVSSGDERRSIDVQPRHFPWVGIPFAEMLAAYDVQYSDASSLDDLETEFWKAFFADPNDQFGDDQYCHSPWFERCCRAHRTVGSLKERGEWDDMIFQMRPWKTTNHPFPAAAVDDAAVVDAPVPAPANVAVAHLDNQRVAVWLNGRVLHGVEDGDQRAMLDEYLQESGGANELKVMVLLKV
jgi:hypothetical protein